MYAGLLGVKTNFVCGEQAIAFVSSAAASVFLIQKIHEWVLFVAKILVREGLPVRGSVFYLIQWVKGNGGQILLPDVIVNAKESH